MIKKHPKREDLAQAAFRTVQQATAEQTNPAAAFLQKKNTMSALASARRPRKRKR
jgi:hypothetical protein